MNNRITKKSVGCIMVAVIMVVGVVATPFRAFAEFEEEDLPLIDTSTAEIKNAWMQLKNAAIIHLVAQTMRVCAENGHLINSGDGDGGFIGVNDVKKGSIFERNLISTAISVGPWFGSLFKHSMVNLVKGSGSGVMQCNNKTENGNHSLFDVFVYILKYHAGANEEELSVENINISEEERMKIICDGTNPGLFEAADNEGCGSKDVISYFGLSPDKQVERLKKVYNEFKENAGNEYIVEWDRLKYFDATMDGYYLYSKDYEVQCGSDTFVESLVDETGVRGIKSYKVDNESGEVSEGYYRIKNSDNTARQSFTDKMFTCDDLVQRMNETIKLYLKKVNKEVYNSCKDGIDNEIRAKEQELNEKYLNNDASTEEEKNSAKALYDEYKRIESEKEYTAKVGEDGELELIKVGSEDESDMPDDYIWTCRASLPKINVKIQEEGAVDDALEEAFDDPCYEAVDLAWVVCPVINALAGTVDGLMEMIEEFF